jgi:hypothetical protein
MTAPKRTQRKRTKGWRMPEGAVYVGRPTVWGNPFKVGELIRRTSDDDRWPYIAESVPGGARGFVSLAPLDQQQVVDLFTNWLIESPWHMITMAEHLGGRDLACWCALNQPCHADVLLELANGGVS